MFILIGLLIGFAAAIPLGPVNVFVVSQTLKHNYLHGLMAGMTTAVMDTAYCLIALVGFFRINIDLKPYMSLMKIIATLLLVGLGIRLIKQSRTFEAKDAQEKPMIKSSRPVFGVFFLYISNPTLYAFWIAVAGTATAHHLVRDRGWMPVVFAIACGLGSLLWYLILVHYVSKHQHKIQPSTFQRVFLGMGVAMIGFGLYTFASIFF